MSKNLLSLTLVQNAYGFIFKENPFYVMVSKAEDKNEEAKNEQKTDAKQEDGEKKESAEDKSLKKLNQRLADLSILDIQVVEHWNYPTQPTETGIVNQDTRIRLPITVAVRFALPTEGGDDYLTALKNPIENFLSDKPATGANNKMFEAIQTAIKNNYRWTVVTKTKVYENLYVSELPTDITPDNVNRMIYTLHMTENIIETENKPEVKESKDEDKGFFSKLKENVSEKWQGIKETVSENTELIKGKFDNVVEDAKGLLSDSESTVE